MSISFSGLGSGMDYSSWVEQLVAVKEQSIVTPLTEKKTTLETTNKNIDTIKSSFSTLSTQMQKILDSKNSTSANFFQNNKVTVSDEKYLTATATNTVPKMDFTVEVSQLATSTTLRGAVGLQEKENPITTNTSLSSFDDFEEGSFVLALGSGENLTINISSSDKISKVIEKINSASEEIEASLDENGKLSIISKSGNEVKLGQDSTSNFAEIMNLENNSDFSSITSSKTVFTEPTPKNKVKLVDQGFSIGEFKINGQTFSITENTTMDSLMNSINTNSKTGVNAIYNTKTNTFSLISKETGSNEIEIEEVSSNFIEKAGLNDTNAMTLGKDAIFSINGEQLTSNSNNITSEDTGIVGLTLNLNTVTEEDSPIVIKVTNDTDSVVSSIKDFISAFNDSISKIDQYATSGQTLAFESALTSARNNMRTIATSKVENDGIYKNLSSIGITTGKVGTSVSSDTNKLVLDESAFKEALEKDPNSVQELLISMTKTLEAQTKKLTDPTEGYFVTKSDSISKQITRLEEDITQKQKSLSSYESTLTKQFQNMDSTISKLQQQYSNMTSVLGS